MKSQKHYFALAVRGPLSVRAILEALILDFPCSGIEEKADGFLACFPEGTPRTDVLNIAKAGEERVRMSGIPGVYEISVREIPYTDWSVQWLDMCKPVEVGETLVVMASWHDRASERIPVVIDPSMAFGTGEHPTTRLCLELIERCAGPQHPESLLDIGTGTGILAIAAAKLGFRNVSAIDSDPVSVEIARQNIRNNFVPDIVISGGPLAAVSGRFDVIVGNLTSETIKQLFDDILKRLKQDGSCIFSGILQGQKYDMLDFFRVRGVQHIGTRELDEWCAMVIRS